MSAALNDLGRMQKAVDAADGPRVELVSGAAVELRPVSWLVPGWLAAGKLHVLGGAPGTGKTTIALAIGAILTVGGRWPRGDRVPAGDVLIWSGEDSADDTLIPRIVACGGDRSRVYVVGEVHGADAAGRARMFDPAADMALLMQAAARLPDLRLVIIDPIVSAVAGDSHKNAEVRRGLAPLVELAERTKAAVLGITHLSKGTAGRDPIERLTGSLAFGALARVVFLAARLPNEEGDARAFMRAKSNIGPDDGGLRYVLRHDQIEGHAGIIASRIEWGEPIEGSARDVLAAAEAAADASADDADDSADSAIGRACAWLRAEVAKYPDGRDKREIVAAAIGAGHRERLIEAAAKRIGIKSSRHGFGEARRAVWRPAPIEQAAAVAHIVPAEPAPISANSAISVIADSDEALTDMGADMGSDGALGSISVGWAETARMTDMAEMAEMDSGHDPGAEL